MACGSCGGGGKAKAALTSLLVTRENTPMAAQTPRPMVNRAAGGMSMTSDEAKKPVQPTWSGEARLPQALRIPVEVSNAVWGVGNGRREIVIRKDGELPAFIIEWMKTNPRYRTWFLSEQPKLALSEVEGTLPAEQPDEPVVTLPAAVEVEPDTVEIAPYDDPGDKPIKRGRRKKAAYGDKENA